MEYFTLLRGRAKSRLKPVMIDTRAKVERYQRELQASDPGSGKTWHYDIVSAGTQAKPWRQRPNGTWKNYNTSRPPLVKNGSRS